MLIYFFEADGITPYGNSRQEMVGGTQENPVLEWKVRQLVAMCPGRKVGDVFCMQTHGGWGRSTFLVFAEGRAKKVFRHLPTV